MIPKKTILEKYLYDLKTYVPQSPARDQRIELMEAELKELDDTDFDQWINCVAKKKALKYAYANEHAYNNFVKAITEGSDFVLEMFVDKK